MRHARGRSGWTVQPRGPRKTQPRSSSRVCSTVPPASVWRTMNSVVVMPRRRDSRSVSYGPTRMALLWQHRLQALHTYENGLSRRRLKSTWARGSPYGMLRLPPGPARGAARLYLPVAFPSPFASPLPSAFASPLPSPLAAPLPVPLPPDLPEPLPELLPAALPSAFISPLPSVFVSALPSPLPSV